jgi:hypothetical protein
MFPISISMTLLSTLRSSTEALEQLRATLQSVKNTEANIILANGLQISALGWL